MPNEYKIIHYKESSFECDPSFILENKEGQQFISNGSVFEPIENMYSIIKGNGCEEEIRSIMQSPEMDDSLLENGESMFFGSDIKEPGDYPSLKKGRWMYEDCELKKAGDYPLLEISDGMYAGCNLTEVGVYPELKYSPWMYEDCDIKKAGDYPLLKEDRDMYSGCPISK